MSKLPLFGLVISFILLTATSSIADMTLATNGQTNYVITRDFAADASHPADVTASQQIQHYLQQITGATYPIQNVNSVSLTSPQIVIGDCARARSLVPQSEWDNLGPDGILIETNNNRLILAGQGTRGTLYAVYQFLEDAAGCRWWTPTENHIPQNSTLIIPDQDVNYTPPFKYREHFTTEVRNDPTFATIMRENGNFQKQTADWGGHYSMLGWVHTFYTLLPPSMYFAQHPEWYSDPNNGDLPCTSTSTMPTASNSQLCLSAPGLVDAMASQALAMIASHPNAGYISISQNDNQRYAKDQASMALAAAEGSQSAPLLNFVNQVAAIIHQTYPDVIVDTLAYHYSVTPPLTIKPGPNVIIRMAPISADFGHPLSDSQWNASTANALTDWNTVVDNSPGAAGLFVWNYVTNFRQTILPHPDWAGLASDLQFFRDNHVTGVFEQGDSYTNGVGDFVQLRTWVIGKLLWNPDLNQSDLINEFLQGYYGAAAPYLRQYIDGVENSFLAQNRSLSTFNTNYSFITLDLANQSYQLFQQAIGAVAGNPTLLSRVNREKLSLDIAVLAFYDGLKVQANQGGLPFHGPNDPYQAMQNFIASAQSYGVSHWGESVTFTAHIPTLNDWFIPAVALPDFADNFSKKDIIDIQQNNFSLYRRGDLTDIIDDTAASDEKVAAMVGDTTEWAIQAHLDQYLGDEESTWHIRALVRADIAPGATLTASDIFRAGIYDGDNGHSVASIAFPMSQVAGEQYQVIDLGVRPLNGGMYIYFAPTNNLKMDALYVDRIILTREVPLPSFAQSFPRSDVIDIQQNNYQFYYRGTLTDLVEDENASDGSAGAIVGDTTEWAVQAKLNQYPAATSGNWHVYALVSADLAPGVTLNDATDKFRAGIYDTTTSHSIASIGFPISDAIDPNDQYQVIDLGAHDLNTDNIYIYFAPQNNPKMEMLYIDRIILIRQNSVSSNVS